MSQSTAQNGTERPYHALSVIPDIDSRILEGIAAGKSLKRIADEYGVTDVAILRRAQKHPGYRDVLAIGTELRMDQRETELESAADNVSVTRADRLLGHARWIAERACPERWGAKTHVTGDLSITVQINRGLTLEGEKPLEISEAVPADSSVINQE